jgi:hypothetical protein
VEYPRISIVTPCYNSATYLEAAITSVLTQGYPMLEYVVIDGASTDSSIDIIERYSDRLAYWVSEPDEGQYHALNKGFAKTTGEVMGYLNADDLLLPGALLVVAEIFRTFPDLEWLSGAHTAILEPGSPLRVIPPARWSRGHLLSEKMDRFMPQESTYWRRSLWDRAGGRLDQRYRLAGDFELWSRFSRHAVPAVVDAPIGCFRFVPGQRSVSQRSEYLTEVADIRRQERARSEADERAARLASKALATRPGSRRRRRMESALRSSQVIVYRSDLGGFRISGDADPDEDLALLARKISGVLSGRERPVITPRTLAKHASDAAGLAVRYPASRLGTRARSASATARAWTSARIGKLRDRLPIYREILSDYRTGARLDYGSAAFHGDRVFQGLIQKLIESVPIGTFVETGTFLGDSSGFVASRNAAVPVYTCDVDPEALAKAPRRLWRLTNLKVAHASSERFLRTLIEQGHIRGIPLFFLDAHWQRYWPLGEELRIISDAGMPAVIVVDDFQVPGRPEFGFDTWDVDGRPHPCDVDLVGAWLDDRQEHQLLVPTYQAEDAFPRGRRPVLRGHLVIFQNLGERFDHLVSSLEVLRRFYGSIELSLRS